MTATAVDRIDALTTVQLPATDDGRWTLTDSTLECQLKVGPDQPTTLVRFRTDDPEIVAESRRPPQLDVVSPTDSKSIADRPARETATGANDETGGFDFPGTTDGDCGSDSETQRRHDREVPSTDPPQDGDQTMSSRGTVGESGGSLPIRSEQEDAYTMPDDEYTEAELIAAGTSPSTDE